LWDSAANPSADFPELPTILPLPRQWVRVAKTDFRPSARIVQHFACTLTANVLQLDDNNGVKKGNRQ
jgi:hypothetical protein